MKLIKLTYYNTDTPIYVNPEYIVAVTPKESRYSDGVVIGSVITLSSAGSGDNDSGSTITVKETPDDIMKLLYWEEVGHEH